MSSPTGRSSTPESLEGSGAEGEYFPQSESNTNEEPCSQATPRKRKATSTVAPSARERARSVIAQAGGFHSRLRDPLGEQSAGEHHDFCIVTAYRDDMCSIEFSHVIAKSTPQITLTKLEWAWNLPWKAFNVDTRHNIQTLTVATHKCFDNIKSGWFWVPADLLLLYGLQLKCHEMARFNPAKLYVPLRTTFPYRLLAFPGMTHFASLSTYDGPYPGSSHQHFTRHSYPFETLPMYNLSIEPHFVIYDTGMKLATALHPCSTPAETLQANIERYGLRSRVSFEAALLDKLHIPAAFTDILEHLWICYSLYLRWMLSKPTPPFAGEPALSRAPSHSSARNRLPDSRVRPTTRSSAHAAPLASSAELSTGTAGPTEEDGVLPMDSISCVTPFGRASVEGTDFEGRDEEEDDTSIVDLEEDVEHAASFILRIETWVKGALHADPPIDGGRLDDGMSDSTTLVGDSDSVKDGSRAKVAKDGQADTKGKYSVPRFQPSSTKVAALCLTC